MIYHQMHFMTGKKRPKIWVTKYLTAEERRDMIKTCGEPAVLLFDYYIKLASLNEPEEITDEKAGHFFGWSWQKAQRYRIKLTKAGWVDQTRYTLRNGNRGITYYLGQEAVKAHREGVNRQ